MNQHHAGAHSGRPRGASGNPVLAAKLAIPPMPPVHLVRRRLLDALTTACKSKLTAITGPAGSGKTTLTAYWARIGLAPGPVAWVTLDRNDNTPAAFWTYIVHALRRGVPGLDVDTRSPAPSGALDRSRLTRLAAGLAAQPAPVVLVLDQADPVTNRAVAADLDLLLRYSTPGLHVIVVGRGARIIPLYRYQLTGELAEIGADDLALSPVEATDLLRAYGVRVTGPDRAALYEHAEGWITAVCLHAMALQAAGDPAAGFPVPGGHQAVADFLRTEVLDSQPARVRDMLLRTSIVEEVHPDLADRLTGRYDARGNLDELVRANAFVRPLDDSRYRVAPVFREVLGHELTTRYPDQVRRLHRRAARWYADQRLFAEALRHAVTIGDWEYACGVAVHRLGVAWLLTAPDAEPCRSVLADLPATRTGAAADLVRAVLALARFDLPAARAAADRAQASTRRLDSGRIVPLLLGIATVRVVLGRLGGDVDATASAAADLEPLWSQLPPGTPVDEARTRAFVLSNLGVAQFWSGRFPEARHTLTRAAAATEPGTGYAVHDALAHLALMRLHEGRLHQAERDARESLLVADRAGLRAGARVGAASVTLAAVALMRNDLPAVREHLSRVIVAAGSRHDPPTATGIALLRARTARGRLDGRRAFAAVEAARASVAALHPPPVVADQIEMMALRVHLLLADTVAARRCLDRIADDTLRAFCLGHVLMTEGDRTGARQVLAPLATPDARPMAALPAVLALGRIAADDGDTDGAAQALRQALEYARTEHVRRPFVEAGGWVAEVLGQHPELAAEHRWLTSPAGPPRPGGATAMIPEPLTERETEVLQRLAQALSTEDIADALYLSVNTVKTHLKSIYRKLGTTGRSAAARRARELNLLPDE
jgi:LuxR family maltose regulon positive regulatory protein